VPSLKDIKRRITSVRKTQQITRAMRMVAGAKLRRAQSAIESARPYADRMRATLAEVARAQRDSDHPLLVPHPEKRNVELLVVTSDRGLCGAFNANVIKLAVATARARIGAGAQVSISTAGKKAREAFVRRAPDALREHYPQDGWVTFGQAADAAVYLSRRYATGEVDEVVLVYSEFVSAITQTPRAVTLLPFTAGETEPSGESEPTGPKASGDELPYEFEPDPARLLAVLVPKAVEVEVFRALLENQSGEHAARMAAMEAATRNTEELISSLTLQYNRARQAAITKELVEIVSGAEAL
jgi:F-type H+-transporting ATPase subunit gamma